MEDSDPVTRTSSQTAKVQPGKLTAAKPAITGTLKVGKTLNVKRGTWTSGTRPSYQWLRGGKTIKGATKASYKLKVADAGKKISVRMTGKLVGYSDATRVSSAKVVPKVLKAVKPKLSGTTRIGNTLQAKPGKWTAKTKFKYQWLRNGKAIKGATKSKYALKRVDGGKKVSVRVTGKLRGYATEAKTSSTKRVPRVLKAAKPRILGNATVTSTLRAKPGKWTSGAKLKYQWLRNGKAIKGATKPNYKIKAADWGKRISVRIKGAKSGYASETRVSKASGNVKYPSRVDWSYRGWNCPSWAPVKGNQGSYDWIYHVPGSTYYDRTNPEECFSSASAASRAGYRAPLR